MLVPIGAWCRTVIQVNQFLEEMGERKTSYPFDWTITPFQALRVTFGCEFNPQSMLRKDNLELSRFGSIVDSISGLIFHHALSPEVVKEMADAGECNLLAIPFELAEEGAIAQTKRRFLHAYSHLEILRSAKTRIGFVRWNREGHPDKHLPEAFDCEDIATIHALLVGFLGHRNISVLQVVTEPVGAFDVREPIKEFFRSEYGVRAVIREKESLDPNVATHFKGDSASWSLLLSRFVKECSIGMESPEHYSGG